MMIDLEQLEADREAGTTGPWIVRTLENFGYNIVHYKDCDKFNIIRVVKTASEHDARRVARLPDLEEAYISSTEKVAELQAKLDKAVEALQEILSRRQYRIDFYHRNGPQW